MFKDDKYVQQRIEKANLLRENGLDPYCNQSKRNSTISKFLNVNSDIFQMDNKRDEHRNYTLSGRIKIFNVMGKNTFLKIEDESGMVQVFVSRDDLAEGFYNNIFKKTFQLGDIIEINGYPFVTKTGEMTLYTKEIKMLTKGIHDLPEKFHGLNDKETRYKQRYLDLIVNKNVKETFKTRSKVFSLTRRFFENKGFMEVETPVLNPIAGGASAKPFVTHHNALDVQRFLRIAPELYLKRLVVGGFEQVFEISKNFRNEGIDATHNPEFTTIEFYWAYKTYKDLIEITKEYFEYLFEHLELPTRLPYGDLIVDFDDIKEIPLIKSLTDIGGVPSDVVNDKEKIISYLKEHNVDVNEKLSLGYLQGELFDEFVEEKLINPTFITEYPVDLSPLARRNNENPDIVDRFELFIAGREIANAFSELNDPLDQLKRFEEQITAKENGDDEAHEMDEDFITALAYGMAPTAGQGIGLDRLVMLLTNEMSIRDVLLFPAMKES